MLLKEIQLKNIKSFIDEKFKFKEEINLIVGPNAGGKTNLLDILITIIGNVLVQQWSTQEQDNVTNIVSSTRVNLPEVFDKFIGKETEKQEITMTVEITDNDVGTISWLREQKELITKYEIRKYKTEILKNKFFDKFQSILIENLVGKKITFTIIDGADPIDSIDDQWKLFYFNFLRYYRFFEILISEMIVDEDENLSYDDLIKFLRPPFMYFSPNREFDTGSFIVKLHDSNDNDIIASTTNANSNSKTPGASLGARILVRKYDNDVEAQRKKEFSKKDPIVSLNKYIAKLGYKGISVKKHNYYQRTHKLTLIGTDNKEIDLNKTSSGQQEIIGFLLGLIAYQVGHGVVIIDEPELHLHPKWQKIQLEIFNEIAEKNKTQLFIVTHSPHYITPDNLNQIIRLHKIKGESKAEVNEDIEIDISDANHLVHATNNEKVFFTDKVILVEGIIDKIIFQAILDKALQNRNDQSVQNGIIEVIEVIGRKNLEKYSNFLKKWNIANYRIADKDYLKDVGDTTIKSYLTVDWQKMNKIIHDKKGRDAEWLQKLLNEMCGNGKLSKEMLKDLCEFRDYLMERSKKFKDLTEEEDVYINGFVDKLFNEKKIYCLKKGEIEEYFQGENVGDISNAIKIAQKIKTNKFIPNSELTELIEKIIYQ